MKCLCKGTCVRDTQYSENMHLANNNIIINLSESMTINNEIEVDIFTFVGREFHSEGVLGK